MEMVYMVGDYSVIEMDGHTIGVFTPCVYDVVCIGIDRIIGRGSYRDMVRFANFLAE